MPALTGTHNQHQSTVTWELLLAWLKLKGADFVVNVYLHHVAFQSVNQILSGT